MPQIFDAIANENARYKRNELEFSFATIELILTKQALQHPRPVPSFSHRSVNKGDRLSLFLTNLFYTSLQ